MRKRRYEMLLPQYENHPNHLPADPHSAGRAQDRQQPGFSAGARADRQWAGRHRRGRLAARSRQGDHRRPVQPQHRLRAARAFDRREPAGDGAALAEDAPPHALLRPLVGNDHRDGGRRHGAVGPEGKALSRADPSALGRNAARADSGVCLDPLRPRRPRDQPDRPPLARRRLSRHQVRLGADGPDGGARH